MRVRLLPAVLLLPLAASVPVILPAAPAMAVEEDCGAVQVKEAGEARSAATRESAPLEQLRIADAHAYLAARGRQPGAGVTVAVLDSGVTASGGLRVSEHVSVTGRQGELDDWHGTAVAGLIAGTPRADDAGGLVGIAPYAEILDVRVFDSGDAGSTEGKPVSADGLVEGLGVVLAHPEVDIVNVSLFVDQPDPRIEKLLTRLHRRGVVVVAAAGNRPTEDDQPLYDDFGTPEAGQDAALRVFPAGYPSVVAVSATVDGLGDREDAAAYVLPNSRTDVAAPVVGGVTVGVDGGTCTVDDVVTSWAAAEVSGVLALMRTADPDATGDQLVARLLSTADGRTDVRSPMTGAGVVQPLDALRRPVTPAEDGTLDTTAERSDRRAVAPEPEVDTMAATRRDAVWWGVLGGGVLLLALVLRPLLARRGPRSP
ncbi:membrane-anchored mycosin MYCP [Nocardioides lianchengensis]|uniref:Membrane-anchored mycosin MYCP n=1 Tax=Nocardioides lianchengensis TaxID=1045774 RepID=A0A1G6Q660_9ACTN|nr:membrane-anchored mycosin MYCP [Nocardioides lianchengensis]